MTRPLVLALALLGATGLAAAAPEKGPDKRPRKAVKTKQRSKGRSGPSRYAKGVDATTTPAWTYGQMSQDECEAELTTRQIGFTRQEASRGVRAPVRLTGKLHGVEFNTDENPERRATSPYMLADCRLILAMDDFSKILEAHDIVEVRHYSMWRPPEKSWPEDKEASRHAGALALDAGRFMKSDGKTLDVTRDFHGAIGAKILCDTAAEHMFNVMLTPNFNKPHHNHFHLEVTSGVKWFLLH